MECTYCGYIGEDMPGWRVIVVTVQKGRVTETCCPYCKFSVDYSAGPKRDEHTIGINRALTRLGYRID